MAPHSSSLGWKIPWTEEPGRLQSMGSLRIGHNWATSLSLFTFMHWRRKWQPLQCPCLENPRDGGAWWASIYGVAQSQTWLKRLSSSSRVWAVKTIYKVREYMKKIICVMRENDDFEWLIIFFKIPGTLICFHVHIFVDIMVSDPDEVNPDISLSDLNLRWTLFVKILSYDKLFLNGILILLILLSVLF